jgi:hypothetical protein
MNISQAMELINQNKKIKSQSWNQNEFAVKAIKCFQAVTGEIISPYTECIVIRYDLDSNNFEEWKPSFEDMQLNDYIEVI